MALINKNTKILVSPPFFLRVKEFFGNSGQMDSTINKWLEDNEDGWVFKGSEKEKQCLGKTNILTTSSLTVNLLTLKNYPFHP